ncbi:hypothetical protein EQG41_21165, partial [Billgrantia azerbaijanica]
MTAELDSNGTQVGGTGTATIVDNDEPGVTVDESAVDAAGEAVNEGDQAFFTVNVTQAAEGSTLTLALNDGTATEGDDYQAAFDYSLDGGSTWTAYSGAITLPQAGDQTVQVRTQTIDDSVDEPAETYQLTAELDSNGTQVGGTGTATIVDNDEP